MTLRRNGILVFTPRIRNSDNARFNRSDAPRKVLPLAETFTNIESK